MPSQNEIAIVGLGFGADFILFTKSSSCRALCNLSKK